MNRRLKSTNDLLFSVVEWAFLMLIWLLLVGKLEWAETWMGVAASAMAATAATIVNRKHFAPFYPETRWIFEAWRLPGYLIADAVLIYAALFEFMFSRKQVGSRIHCVPFRSGGSDERSATRRALATILTTLPPNYLVIGIDQEQNLMLVHQIRPSEMPKLTEMLEAK
jgi:multisubunit Na+/H+ antiporter MnhE subunit